MPCLSRASFLALLVLLILVCAAAAAAQGKPAEAPPPAPPCRNPETPRLVTAGKQGYYHRVGTALQKTLRERRGVDITLDNTDGSKENIERLRACRAEFAIVQSDLMHRAWMSEPPFEGASGEDIRLVRPLFIETVHILVQAHKGFHALEELHKKPVWLGRPDSGSHFTAQALFDAANFEPGSPEDAPEEWALDGALQRLSRGEVVAVFHTSVAPTGSVEEASRRHHLRLVPLDWQLVERLAADGSYVGSVVPSTAYERIGGGALSAGVQAFLVVREGYWNARRSVVEQVAEALRKDREALESHLAGPENLPVHLELLRLRPHHRLLQHIPGELQAYLPYPSYWRDLFIILGAVALLAALYWVLHWVPKLHMDPRKHWKFLRNHPQAVVLVLANLAIWLVGSYILYWHEGYVNESFSSPATAVWSTLVNILARIPTVDIEGYQAMTPTGRTALTTVAWLFLLVFISTTWPVLKRLGGWWKRLDHSEPK